MEGDTTICVETQKGINVISDWVWRHNGCVFLCLEKVVYGGEGVKGSLWRERRGECVDRKIGCESVCCVCVYKGWVDCVHVCVERLACVWRDWSVLGGKLHVCMYVWKERCGCGRKEKVVWGCLYREGAYVFGGFCIPLFMWKDWVVCLCLLVYNMCVCRNR